jgi:hypothetical protein
MSVKEMVMFEDEDEEGEPTPYDGGEGFWSGDETGCTGDY